MCPPARAIKTFRAFRGRKIIKNNVGLTNPRTKILPDSYKQAADENPAVLIRE